MKWISSILVGFLISAFQAMAAVQPALLTVVPGTPLYPFVRDQVPLNSAAIITVEAGRYDIQVTNLAKEGVTWFLKSGVVISNGVGNRIFDNSGAGNILATNWSVIGDGEIIQTSISGPNGTGAITVSNAASTVKIQCRKAMAVSGNASVAAVSVLDALDVELDIGSVEGTSCPALWWRDGRTRGRVGRIVNNSQGAFYCDGTKANDINLACPLIYATNGCAIIFNPVAPTGFLNSKLWLDNLGGEIVGSPDLYNGVITMTNGKVYLHNVGKLSQGSSSTLSGGGGDPTLVPSLITVEQGFMWYDGEKMTCTNDTYFIHQNGGFTDFRVEEYEDGGSGANIRPFNFFLTGGTNTIHGGRATTTWGPGYKLAGGVADLRGFSIDTFSTLQGSNAPIWWTGGDSNLVLRGGCSLRGGSHFSITNASAANLLCYGTGAGVGRSNLTATITVRVGTFLVDGWVAR